MSGVGSGRDAPLVEQPPELSAPPPPLEGATHWPEGSHTFGVAQSSTDAQCTRHCGPSHLNGVQSTFAPPGFFTV
jgi:hypothetical protein